jgi:hypothetical protein
MVLQKSIDPQRDKLQGVNINHLQNAASQLPIEFALGAATGFSQAIAGLLWVRTDEFFDKGDYDAIIPMVRIITWLDPHNIDVYETGAWHLDYNFTDTDQRSDRRYIPVAIALEEEGIKNNPDVPELYADLAFTHYFRKTADFPKAVEWYKKAEQIPGWDVTKVGHGLAHAYVACGEIPEAIAQWKFVIAQHQLREKTITDKGLQYAEHNGEQIAVKNLYETQQRYIWRKTQTQPPVDAGFSAKVIRIAPMVFVVSGTMNGVGTKTFNLATGQHGPWVPTDGTRVEIRLQDASYKVPNSATFSLNNNVSNNTTIMQDSASVRAGKWQKRIDMSKDHFGALSMYSFTAPKYTLQVWYNPSDPNSTPPNVGDRFGWVGEGVTDKNYLDAGGNIPGTAGGNIPGLHIITKTFTLTRDDVMGDGLKTFN